MGDHTCSTETFQQSQSRQNDEGYARVQLLGRQALHLNQASIPWILNHIDCFVSQSRGNESVEDVFLSPYAFDGHDEEVLDKLGQALGNLHALKDLYICTSPNCYHQEEDSEDDDSEDEDSEDEDDVVPIPHWEILAHLLRHVRQKIQLNISGDRAWDGEQSRLFSRAIRGHPTITSLVDSRGMFPYESLDALYSALATLPALESIALSNHELHAQPEDEYALAYPESLTELLRVPSLRSVCFYQFYFTRALCQATTNALMEGTAVTKLEFIKCSFSAGEFAAIMTSGLGRNTSVSRIEVEGNDDHDLSPVLLALGKNTGLRDVSLGGFGSIDESLCTAMQNGLGMNGTLESLELNRVHLTDDNSDLWCRALSFLRTSKALKSLVVNVVMDVTESCFAAFRTDIAVMLQENVSLESLSIRSWSRFIITAEEYLVLITALQHNTTLKTLTIYHIGSTLHLSNDEDKEMAVLLKKNYAMESLPDIDLHNEAGYVGAILRLNEAGRRYLVQDGSSVSKGVKVLSAVSNEINCVFLHLLENPRLCDRSAVEAPAKDSTDNGGSTSPVDHAIGKREYGRAQTEGKESRRQLT
jgi:hypothetical protein